MAKRLGYVLFAVVFFLLLLFALNVNAQESKRTFANGIITDSSTGETIQNVHVINMQNGYGMTTDNIGLFRIPAKATDTLRFSAIGYEITYVPANLFLESETPYTFSLKTKVYMLDEADVMELKWQMFKQEVLSMEIPEEQWEDKRWISNYFSEEQEEKLKELAGSPGNLSYYTKEDRQRIKLKEVRRKDKNRIAARKRVSKKLVAHLTKLQGAELDSFYKTIRFDPDHILAMNDYQLTLHIDKLYEEYLVAKRDTVHD